MSRTEGGHLRDRDWRLVERLKTDFWIEQKAVLTPSAVLQLGEELRRYVKAARPDWPDPAERDADLAVHTGVSEALRREATFRSRSSSGRSS